MRLFAGALLVVRRVRCAAHDVFYCMPAPGMYSCAIGCVSVDPIRAGSGGRRTEDDDDDDESGDELFGERRWLTAMYCFFSTSRQGYQYSVLLCTPATLVTTYPYISQAKAVSIAGSLLQVRFLIIHPDPLPISSLNSYFVLIS